MAWGAAPDDPESVYQQLNLFSTTLFQSFAGVVDQSYPDVFANAPSTGYYTTLHQSFFWWPVGDGTDEFDLDRSYTPAPLTSWRPIPGFSRLDLDLGLLELWFETRDGGALDLAPGDTLFMSMRLTGASGFVLAEATDLQIEWNAAQPCGEGLKRLSDIDTKLSDAKVSMLSKGNEEV